MFIGYIIDYIKKNRIEIIENSVIYILGYRNEILNFSITNLDELDSDSDDNVSRKECINGIKDVKKAIDHNNLSDIKEVEILDMILQIKNNSKNMDEQSIEIIKKYIEVIITILDQIKLLFNND
jgi:hypothetical protein